MVAKPADSGDGARAPDVAAGRGHSGEGDATTTPTPTPTSSPDLDTAVPRDERPPVLIVSGAAENILELTRLLEPTGARTLAVSTAGEALRALALDDPAVVLLDHGTLTWEPFQVIQSVRDMEDYPSAPVILLMTGEGAGQHPRLGYDHGAVDVMVMPLDPGILRAKVLAFVALQRKNLQLREYERLLREWEGRRAEEALRDQAASLAATTAQLTSLNAELHRGQAELRYAMGARNRFYASMSHELRTPINAIIGYGSLLLDGIYGPMEGRQREGLERSHRAALHLLELVNDMLDLSKVEAGRTELALQPVSARELLDDLRVTMQPIADEHGCRLVVEVDQDVTVETDPRRVRQVLMNLLSNAIKFGGGHPVTVCCLRWGDGGLEIQVADMGGGIAADDQARIFDDFVQLPGQGTHGEGTGLGLAISRRLAHLLGGVLAVDSREGEGSTFYLRLPHAADAPPDGPMDAPEGAADRAGARPTSSPPAHYTDPPGMLDSTCP